MAHRYGPVAGSLYIVCKNLTTQKEALLILTGGSHPACAGNSAQLDGQIRELDEPFEIAGIKVMFPGDFGVAAEDVNCRCACLQRAKWELDEAELQILKDRAEYFGLDKTDSFEDFKQKYILNSENIRYNKIKSQNEIIERAKEFAQELLDNNSLLRYDNGYPISNYVNAKIDYDGIPRVLTSEEFEKVSSGKNILYRGIKPNENMSGLEMAEEFKYGKFFCGRGIYGNGTYCTSKKEIASTYSGGNGTILELFLDNNSNIIDFREIYKEYEKTGIPKIIGEKPEAYQDV